MKPDRTRSDDYHFDLVSFLYPQNSADAHNGAWKEVPYTNNDQHLIHVLSGRGRVWINDNSHVVEPGTVIFIPAHETFVFEIQPGEHHMLNAHFHLTTSGGRSISLAHEWPRTFKPDSFRQITKDLAKAHEVWSCGDHLDRCRVAAQLHLLVIEYLQGYAKTRTEFGDHDQSMEALRIHIGQGLDRDFDPGDYASHVHLSISQMNRRFKKCFSLSPRDYWDQQRNEEVSKLLAESSMTLQDIAQRYAFNSVNYFVRWFKKKNGISPFQYRKSITQHGGKNLARVF